MKYFLPLFAFCCFSSSLFAEKTKFFQAQHIEIVIDGESNFYCFDYSYFKDEGDEDSNNLKLEGFYSENTRFNLPQIAADYLFETNLLMSYKPLIDTLSYSTEYEKCTNNWIKVTDINLDGKDDVCILDINSSGKGGSYFIILIQFPDNLVYWKSAPNPYFYSDKKRNMIFTHWRSGGGSYYRGKYKLLEDTTVQLIRAWNTFEDNLKNSAHIMHDSILIDSIWEVRIDSNFRWEEDGGDGSFEEYFN